jgi:hypothetical protein
MRFKEWRDSWQNAFFKARLDQIVDKDRTLRVIATAKPLRTRRRYFGRTRSTGD